ncbi:MAG: ribosome maturation factor RimM [Burkholderiales bacterium]|nr:MAG: ribosome maturation factor RimM [Burkholderiales bacterium]
MRRPESAAKAGVCDAAHPAIPADLVEVGTIAGAYGVGGWVRIATESAPEASVLLGTGHWYLSQGLGQDARPFPIESCRVHGSQLLARPERSLEREQIEALRGSAVLVSRASFPEPDENEYYWVDLIGCEVLDAGDRTLGTVGDVVDHGAHAILAVNAPDGRTHLIPFVAAYVAEVDLARRRIRTQWLAEYTE